MSESSQAAEQIIKMTLDGTEYAVRIVGSIGTELAKKLSDAMRSSRPSRGRNRLKELLRSGKELSLFSIQNRDVNRFAKEARRYGITFSMVKDRNEKDPRSVVDVIVKKEDVVRVNRIIDRYLSVPLPGDREEEAKNRWSLAGGLSGRSSEKKRDIDYSSNRVSVRKKLKRLMKEKQENNGKGLEKIRKER